MVESTKKQKKEVKDLLKEILDKNKMQDYLDFYSHHCSKYSMLNTLRIFSQRPNATYVAGRKQWREKGRIIKPGEVPMILYAPKFEWEEVKGRKVKVLKDWNVIEVFDISQTTLEAIDPEVSNVKINLSSFNSPNANSLFNHYAEKFGFKVVILEKEEMEQRFGAGCTGYIDYNENTAYIQKAEDLLMLKSLFHEGAHYYLKHNELNIPKNEREIEAELAAYVCCKYLDLNIENISMPYIASWINASENKQIKYNLERIEKFVKYFSAL